MGNHAFLDGLGHGSVLCSHASVPSTLVNRFLTRSPEDGALRGFFVVDLPLPVPCGDQL